MNESPINHPDSRVDLANYRTSLALDRTTLAWVRTTLGMASFGFGMVAFFRTLEERTASPRAVKLHHGAILIGTALLVLGIIMTLLASASHLSARRKLRRGEAPDIGPWPLSITIALLFSIISLAGLWALFAE